MDFQFSTYTTNLIRRTLDRINKPAIDILLNHFQIFENALFKKICKQFPKFNFAVELTPTQVYWLRIICQEYDLSPHEVFEFFFDLYPKN